MRNVIIAAVLLCLTVVLSVVSGCRSTDALDALMQTVRNLPERADGIALEAEDSLAAAQAVRIRWEKVFPYLAYICGYTALNRADEAVWELYAAISSEMYADAANARYKLIDALRRMLEQEKVSFASVF
ncbi:MAG: hypothetical protein IJ302_02655 [Clostridia bacterium]|nr:hypothetical protein [Clostridia bacterium]